MKRPSKALRFIGCALLAGVALLACEHWYEMTFGIKYRTLAWWVATALDGAPFMFAIAVSGNVHQGSTAGYWTGFVLQWVLLGLLAYGLTVVSRKIRSGTEAK